MALGCMKPQKIAIRYEIEKMIFGVKRILI